MDPQWGHLDPWAIAPKWKFLAPQLLWISIIITLCSTLQTLYYYYYWRWWWQALKITFVRFKLEDHPNCTHDFLQVHDGITLATRRIGRYCGSTLPAAINTTHYIASLWFHADASINLDGFSLNWVSVRPSQLLAYFYFLMTVLLLVYDYNCYCVTCMFRGNGCTEGRFCYKRRKEILGGLASCSSDALSFLPPEQLC